MNRFIVPVGFGLALVFSFTVWWYLPMLGEFGDTVKKGGPLVAFLILLIILQTTFILERVWSPAQGARAGTAAGVPERGAQAPPHRRRGRRDPGVRGTARLGGQRDPGGTRAVHADPQ
jgi:hypothetical protein